MEQTILVVDDEREIADLVEVYLKNEGFPVLKAYTAAEALEIIAQKELSLAILDVMLPDMDGFTLCQKIRESHLYPILMLSAKVEDMDKIMGLTLGADDYITKPYNPTILLLHIEAVFKRLHKAEPKLTYQNIRVNLMKSTLEKDDQELLLSKNEMGIFYYLLMNQGKIVTRDDIMNYLWGTDKFIDDNTLTVNMTRLRKRLEKIGLFDVIETRRDQGYMLI